MKVNITILIILLFQLFQSNVIGAQNLDTLYNNANDTTLSINMEALVIKAEMPVVKTKDGALIFPVSNILKGSAATNAYDILKEIPGLIVEEEKIGLIGARGVKVILNGKNSSMTLEQLSILLKSTPSSRVKSVEVMYIAPARYNYNGSVINVILNDSKDGQNKVTGESGVEYGQSKHSQARLYTNLQYSTSKLKIDFLVSLNARKSYSGEDMYAIHNFKSKTVFIDQKQRRINNAYGGVLRAGMDYSFSDESSISLSYYYNLRKTRYEGDAWTKFEEDKVVINNSFSNANGNNQLHNLSLQYNRKNGFVLGMDYTYYYSNNKLDYRNYKGDEILTNLFNPSMQRVNGLNLYLSKNDKLKGWSIDYGINASYNSSHNKGEYLYEDKSDNNYKDDMKQKEYSGNAYLEASTVLKKKLTLKVGLKGEYYYADNSLIGKLWSKWSVFPTLLLNYKLNRSNILQFTISSDLTYPGYWDLSTRVVPLNAYSYTTGNPNLMPYRSYSARLMYILKNKYIITSFCNYSPDFFVQIPYQKDNELVTVFEAVNFDYQVNTGLSVVIPFRVGNFWDSKLTLTGILKHEKYNNINTISFDRSGVFGMVNMTNTFRIPSVKSLSLSINSSYTSSGAIQGVYDLGHFYSISPALKYVFINNQATLTLSANDLFKSSLPSKIEVNTSGQYSKMVKVNDARYVKLSFSYKFGGYKKLNYKDVDRSRFE
ncbi:MAG: outer membrane beta-barrel protein [Bacteroidales bacterium]